MKLRVNIPWLSLVLGVLAIALFLTVHSSDLENPWIYSRSGILQGELWRMASGHLVHYSAAHLYWDLVAFLLLATFTESQIGTAKFALLWIALASVISMMLFWLVPRMEFYAGLSGINYGLLAFWIVRVLQRSSWMPGLPSMLRKATIAAVLVLPILIQAGTGISLIADYRLTEHIAWQSHLTGVLTSWLFASQSHDGFGFPGTGG